MWITPHGNKIRIDTIAMMLRVGINFLNGHWVLTKKMMRIPLEEVKSTG
jgi:hypothetical protein